MGKYFPVGDTGDTGDPGMLSFLMREASVLLKRLKIKYLINDRYILSKNNKYLDNYSFYQSTLLNKGTNFIQHI